METWQLYLASWLVAGVICGAVSWAAALERGVPFGFASGFFFGPFGVLFSLLWPSPRPQCRDCGVFRPAGSGRCPACNYVFPRDKAPIPETPRPKATASTPLDDAVADWVAPQKPTK